ncbi:hypothetical protein V492_02399 [Pseudogymnoascus sp. VKM F-4246]|nr:hypothetical protein V492_02399 [Pseudogymnoascus sp. VKM F-4246]
MAIPVNETTLYQSQFEWRDGPLYDMVDSDYAVYPGNSPDNDQGLRLDLYDDNYASLTFLANSDPDYTSAFALTESIYDPTRVHMFVYCVYPISGQYNTLSRALFYVLIVFSLIFRRHVWLSVAALGTAMTYAAVSAIHLFALVGSFRFLNPGYWDWGSGQDFMDLDLLGIFPILTASGIMLTPILMWSNTVRKHKAQAVVVCWGALIFVALSACLYIIMRGVGLTKGGEMALNTVPSFALCLRSDECNAPQNDGMDLKYYNKCECIDFCGTLSPFAPMRSGENMVPYLITKADKAVGTDNFRKIFSVNLFALLFITVNGAIGVLESYYSQSEVRNAIFRVLNADLRLWIKVLFEGEREDDMLRRLSRVEPKTVETKRKRIRYYIAKSVAASFYIVAIFLSLICPAVFISSIVTSELFIQTFPPSEHSDAIGAWGAWVGAILVIIAAVIARYSKAWLNAIIIILRAAWRVIKYAKTDRHSDERPSLFATDKKMSVTKQITDFFKELGSPFVHGWYSTRRAIWTGGMNMRLFRDWWRNTVELSQMRGDELQLIWEAEETVTPGGKPKCPCRMCLRDIKRKKQKDEKETSDWHQKTALERARTLAQRKRDAYENVMQKRGAYKKVNSPPGAPLFRMDMSQLDQVHDDNESGPASIHTGGMGGSEERLYDRPITPPLMSGSRMSVAYDPSYPPAIPESAMQRPGFQRAESGPSSPPPLVSPHQVPSPEAVLDRRSGYARRDTDQSFGSFSARRESDQSAGTLPRKDTSQSVAPVTRKDTEQSIAPATRRDTDQGIAPATRRDTDQSIAQVTRRDTDMGISTSRPRRKPVASYIAPEGEEMVP